MAIQEIRERLLAEEGENGMNPDRESPAQVGFIKKISDSIKPTTSASVNGRRMSLPSNMSVSHILSKIIFILLYLLKYF